MTVRELLYKVTDYLYNENIENSSYEAKEIISHALSVSVSDLIFRQNDICSDSVIYEVGNMTDRRVKGEPLQYILGEWTFCMLPFKVGKGVLIPRPETEFIVYEADKRLKNINKKVVFDLCAGSGCIGIAVAVNNPQCEVYLLDVSDEAILYSKKNMLLNGVKNVTILKYDLFKGFADSNLPRPDVILSNPPYIKSDEIAALQTEVLKEPILALDGGGDGLDFYRVLSEKWLPYINDAGFFILEAGEDQPYTIKNMVDGFSAVSVEKDIFDVDRFVIGRK